MKKIKLSLSSFVFFAFLGITSLNAQTADEAKGKVIFKENKCISCHGIESQGFLKKGKSSVPDLSDVGSKLKAAFIQKYLKKEEVQNDLKHAISFKGSDDDLTVLAEWLASLKKEEVKDSVKSK